MATIVIFLCLWNPGDSIMSVYASDPLLALVISWRERDLVVGKFRILSGRRISNCIQLAESPSSQVLCSPSYFVE